MQDNLYWLVAAVTSDAMPCLGAIFFSKIKTDQMRLAIDGFMEVRIYARKFWNDTDLEILEREKYIFEVVGEWKDLGKKTDPEGYSNLYMSLFNKWKRSPTEKWFALMGCLNKSNYFLIGVSKQITFEQSGKLYCFANDVAGFYCNNSGYVSMKITRKL